MEAKLNQECLQLLAKYWSHQAFRPMQEEIIESVLSKNDTLALLPTGGGKSICFQIPGLIFGGTTLVISPLISLMNDQVQNLKARGIKAVAIHAAMHYKEIDVTLNNAAYGHVQFLYVSPERIQNENFRQKLSHLPIKLIAVDEAHCISQWGYDFRPSYLKIAELREFFPDIKIIALTASATNTVVADICKQLNFTNHKIVRHSFERKNLRYIVQQEENKAQRLLKLIANIGGSGIVYLNNRNKTQELAKFLSANQISSQAYHAGLSNDLRTKIQANWFEGRTQVICATNAFGMGIDKANVRFVVHLDLPESLEAYFQEAGRAGRDGKTAYASIFFTKSNQENLLKNFENSYPSIDVIKQGYKALCNYYQIAINTGEGNVFDLEIEAVAKNYNLKALTIFKSIKFLEKENYCALLDTGLQPSKVMMLASNEELYNYQIQFPKYEVLIKTILRSYGGLFENYTIINEKDLAYRTKLSAAMVQEQLQFLDKNKTLSYLPQNDLPKLIFLQNRIHEKYLEFNPANYSLLKENHLNKIKSIINYTNNGKVCRQIQLLNYFDEADVHECGHCDVCLREKDKNRKEIENTILKSLKESPKNLETLNVILTKYPVKKWTKVLNELVDEQLICHDEGIYCIK